MIPESSNLMYRWKTMLVLASMNNAHKNFQQAIFQEKYHIQKYYLEVKLLKNENAYFYTLNHSTYVLSISLGTKDTGEET